MDQRTYNIVTATLFLIIAVLHLLRVILGWPARIDGLDIPLWASWLAILVTGGLAERKRRFVLHGDVERKLVLVLVGDRVEIEGRRK